MNDFVFYMAPMEEVTTASFREVCFQGGADAVFTEMARVSALARNNKSTVERIQIPKNIPTYIQILTANEKELRVFLDSFTAPKGFLGFNFNLGCPSPDMIRRGLGAALIKRISKVNKMTSVVREYGYPVSLKLRLGMNGYEKEKKNYLSLIKEVDADFFIVHARHGKENNRNPADFSVYKDCVNTGKVIIANGDISSKEQVEQLRSIGVRGVMIGRAAVENPRIFSELKRDLL